MIGKEIKSKMSRRKYKNIIVIFSICCGFLFLFCSYGAVTGTKDVSADKKLQENTVGHTRIDYDGMIQNTVMYISDVRKNPFLIIHPLRNLRWHLVIEEGVIYKNELLLTDAKGLLSSGDGASSAEEIGKMLIDVLESKGIHAIKYQEMFEAQSNFQQFQEGKWESLDVSWRANSYYDSYCCQVNVGEQEHTYFLYYIYPDYEVMNTNEAKAVIFVCDVNKDGKLCDTALSMYSMSGEEYCVMRECLWKKVPLVRDGKITGGGGYLCPIPTDSDEQVYVDDRLEGQALGEILIRWLQSDSEAVEEVQDFFSVQENEWWDEILEEVRECIQDGWKVKDDWDCYYLCSIEQVGRIHYQYDFYWEKIGEETEKVLTLEVCVSAQNIERMQSCWWLSGISNPKEEYKKTEKSSDIDSFLKYDWTSQEVLMEHEIEPEDSGRGWYFWLADINFDSRDEMLVSFPANHSGGNSLYIYRQNPQGISSYGDTFAIPEQYVSSDIDYKKISHYMDIDLISAYKNPSGEYRYLTLDDGIHGGNIYGNWGYIALYATSLADGEMPVKVAEINYVGPDQTREMYFMGERVYEIGKLQNMIALYMEDYEEVEINKIPIQKNFSRDIVGIDESNQRGELQELYDAIREAAES